MPSRGSRRIPPEYGDRIPKGPTTVGPATHGSHPAHSPYPLPASSTNTLGHSKRESTGFPSIAAQMVVHSSGRFSVSGSAFLENSCQIEVAGSIQGENSRPALEISIRVEEEAGAQQGRGASSRTLCDLETTLTAPIGEIPSTTK